MAKRAVMVALATVLMVATSPLTAIGADNSAKEQSDRLPDKLPKTTRDCMFFRTIYDWKALDPYNLIVWFNSHRTPRHIELEVACYEARFVDTIAFTDNLDGRLCAFGNDSVIVGHQHCPIGAINKITPREAKALIAKYRKRYSKDRRQNNARNKSPEN